MVDKLSFRGLKYNYNIGDVFSSTEISCNKICNFGVDDDYYHNKVLIRVPLMLFEAIFVYLNYKKLWHSKLIS